VSDVEPLFDETTRTLKVRLEMDNPGYALKPGMFVYIDFPVSLPPGVSVPADAVLDSGLRKVVFVDRGNGYFEPRRVETGWHVGDRVEIVRGLMDGERIVVSGNFLLDSETRMKAASVATAAASRTMDPVCGMEVDAEQARAAGRVIEHDHRTYYFCTDDCKKQFAANPERFERR
jgi:YHS domain-containing protein